MLPMKILKSIAAIIFSMIAVFNSSLAEASGDVSKVKIVYGVSDIYSREDMDSAIAIIKEMFSKWDGCELHTIRYTDDDYCNTEKNIKWMNELAEGRGYEADFDQCIAFFSNFHSPSYGNHHKTFNTDSEYEDWSWYLARTNGGEWKLITFGY